MNINHIQSLEQVEDFLQKMGQVELETSSKKEVYEWMQKVLFTLRYGSLKKKEKGLVKDFLKKITGYSTVQLKRLLKKQKQGKLKWAKWQKGTFSAVYGEEDISLLHKVDSAHSLAGPATKKIIQREYEIFGHKEYRKLANISVSHLYNLRHRPSYERQGSFFDKTRPSASTIGTRMKPAPNGIPGFLRVDTVHQGDREGKKGVYHVNVVDEVTQWELVFSTENICEQNMEEILQEIIEACPFKILNFHSDNGSEYINKVIAKLLEKLLIRQTKSRARRSSDNALVEGKNGAVVRKFFGYFHIPATKKNAMKLNWFNVQWLNPYLNFHRPCAFATTVTDKRGKEKKKYEQYMTPYEKLKVLPGVAEYLNPGVSLQDLDLIASKQSDTEFALEMQKQKTIIFQNLDL